MSEGFGACAAERKVNYFAYVLNISYQRRCVGQGFVLVFVRYDYHMSARCRSGFCLFAHSANAANIAVHASTPPASP